MDKRTTHLRKDRILRKLIDRVPPPKHAWDAKPASNHFRALVVAITNQQISGKAADTILKRFIELFPKGKFPTPEQVLKMPTAKMRKAGLSRMKVSFLKDLSKKIINKTVDLQKINRWTDEEVIAHLIEVKGIGRWTAEMFLMFSLGREDVFSYGDLGLRNGMRKLYGLKKHPTPAQAEKIASKWKPYRTLASRYLWASIDVE
jgi:DNA-3-methyladenine glycosylase II